jgi:hypothetical protein
MAKSLHARRARFFSYSEAREWVKAQGLALLNGDDWKDWIGKNGRV